MVDWCCMCKKSVKSIDHLLLHHKIVRELRSFFFQFFSVDWVMPGRERVVSELEMIDGKL